MKPSKRLWKIFGSLWKVEAHEGLDQEWRWNWFSEAYKQKAEKSY